MIEANKSVPMQLLVIQYRSRLEKQSSRKTRVLDIALAWRSHNQFNHKGHEGNTKETKRTTKATEKIRGHETIQTMAGAGEPKKSAGAADYLFIKEHS